MAHVVKPSNRQPAQSSNRDDEKKGHSKSKDLSHVPCKFFRQGQCTAGSACPFSHAAPEPGQPKQICQWFVQGTCRFAHKCANAHIHPGEPMSMDRKNKKAAQQAMQAQAQAGGSSTELATETRSSTSTSGAAGRRDQERHTRKDRDRPQKKEHRGSVGKPSRSGGSDRHSDTSSVRQEDHGMTASVATLRPPIRIGKGPTTSASVTAPPVLRDSSVSQANDLETERKWATASLEQLQGSHTRQNTITPTTENLALSDYSKTPSAAVADLPPQLPTSTSPKEKVQASPSLSNRPLSRAHHHVRTSGDAPGSPLRNGKSDFVSSPRLSSAETAGNKFGPIGSPPRSGLADAANSGRGALSSLLAGLSINPSPSSHPNPPLPNIPPSLPEPTRLEDEPSSVTSQSSIHAHMNTAILGTSPFSVPGSRSLFMNYEPTTSQPNIPPYLAGGHGPINGGIAASFAGSRATGWGAGDSRRPSLPGHNQRPSLGSMRSSALDENAFLEEHEEEAEGLQAEEFLPSSLNNLLTKEERARKFSRSGARPTKASIAGHGLDHDGGDDDGDDDGWNATIRHRPSAENQAANASMFSRSVPATSLLGNVRSLWENSAGGNPNLNENQGLPGLKDPFVGMSRALSSNAANPNQDMFGSLSGSYGPSPSMLSTSVMSNASNAFLKTGRAGGAYGERLGGVGGLPNDLQVGSYTQNAFYQKPPQVSHASHHHHSSLSGIPGAAPSHPQGLSHAHSQSQTQNQYPMYSGPADIANDPKGGQPYFGLQQQPHHGHRPQPLNLNPHIQPHEPQTGLRHEPGQSLPRGLGAGLSRIHFVPAMSLSSTAGSPTTGFNGGMASPPGGSGYSNFGVQMSGLSRGGPGADGQSQGDFAGGRLGGMTPTRHYGSGLTARLAAAGVGSSMNPSSMSLNSPNDLGPNPSGVSLHNVRNSNSPWGSAHTNGQDDVDVDEGTLFSMD